MIDQYEVPGYIAGELPEIATNIKSSSTNPDVYKTIQCLANYTGNKIKQHDFKTIKKCLSIAEYIYSNGNALVRNAVENIFVYSFSSLMDTCGKNERRQLHAIMPLYLYTAYVKHINSSGA